MSQILPRWRWFSLFFSVGLILCLGFHTWSTARAEQLATGVETQLSASSSQEELVQQGLERYQAGQFNEAIALWQQALPQISAAKDRATVHSNLAIAYRQIGQLEQAIAQWEEAIQIYRSQGDEATQKMLAGLLTEQAQAYSDLGQQRRAIKLLQSAIEVAAKNQDRLTEAAARGALGNAHWALGDYEQALTAHETSLKISRNLNNASYIATALNNLGNVYVSRAARYRYQVEIAELEGDDREATRLTQAVAKDRAEARTLFEQSVQATRGVSELEEVRALMNLNRLLTEGNRETGERGNLHTISDRVDRDLIVRNWNRTRELLDNAPDSRDKAYALINLAEQVLQVNRLQVAGDAPRVSASLSNEPSNLSLTQLPLTPFQPSTLLEQALAVAKKIGDARTQSFALGSLGQLNEAVGDYDRAMERTRAAQFAAQQVNALDSLYRWQWQAGRILKVTGDRERAIIAYEQAINSLQSIRGDLVSANKDLQFDFRDSVEPVYRELMQLLLEPDELQVTGSKTDLPFGKGFALQPSTLQQTKNLEKVLDILDLLKLAELQNFFGDECVEVAKEDAKSEVSLQEAGAAIVYSVILDDYTEIILRLANGQLLSHTVMRSQKQMQQDIDQLRQLLEKRSTDEYLIPAQKIYDALIRPLEADLAAANPKTLVFIQDGVLRQVPMAALHDGQKFLIENYAIATTPSLTLTTRTGSAVGRNPDALIMGLTVERPPFEALTNVGAEVESVQEILGGIKLLDREFTLATVQRQLQTKSYPVVHIATHGRFGVDSASTFLLTFDSRLTIEQIDSVLREAELSPSVHPFPQGRKSHSSQQPVELLTLSACQTAVGDNRAALGIAGVAVRAGVRSALASLWYINDEATVPLIEEFYTQLQQPNVTKAEALQKAQAKMIADLEYSHPAVWSPFILIGNWL